MAEQSPEESFPDQGQFPPPECDGGTDTLEEFAAKCDVAMAGVTVPDFNCDDGSPLPGQSGGATCDAPNVLVGECDPGSKFQVLHRNEGGDGIYIVAHCRKQRHRDGHFGDIAIISHNAFTGATCFYQALDSSAPGGELSGDVKAPSKGMGAWPWLSPSATAGINCVQCHDNGAFIRSPYLAQLGEVWPTARTEHDRNYLPGTLTADKIGFNHGARPYNFVGLDFQSWEAHSVTPPPAGALCTTCHRMGVSKRLGSFNGRGTSLILGLRATADKGDPMFQLSKNDHSAASPIWMIPGGVTFSAANHDAATAVHDCASLIVSGAPLPPDCAATRYARGDTCTPGDIVVNGPTHGDPTPKGDVEVPLGCVGGPDCPTGFYYWTSVHGPFYQNTDFGIPFDSPDFRGSYLRIAIKGNRWIAKSVWDSNSIPPGPIGGPGGLVDGIAFSSIKSVPNADDCFTFQSSIADPSGFNPSTSTIVAAPAGSNLPVLSGFIGNVARSYNGQVADSLRMLDGVNSELAQSHSLETMRNGWFTAESWQHMCSGWNTAPLFAVQNRISRDDVQLVPAALRKSVRCFITGIEGDWSWTAPDGMGGVTTPYATIYKGPGGDLRLRVFPGQSSMPIEKRVAAYASCVRVD